MGNIYDIAKTYEGDSFPGFHRKRKKYDWFIVSLICGLSAIAFNSYNNKNSLYFYNQIISGVVWIEIAVTFILTVYACIKKEKRYYNFSCGIGILGIGINIQLSILAYIMNAFANSIGFVAVFSIVFTITIGVIISIKVQFTKRDKKKRGIIAFFLAFILFSIAILLIVMDLSIKYEKIFCAIFVFVLLMISICANYTGIKQLRIFYILKVHDCKRNEI